MFWASSLVQLSNHLWNCVIWWIYVVVSALVALVLYPVSFARELPHGNRSVWEFGWVTKTNHRFSGRAPPKL